MLLPTSAFKAEFSHIKMRLIKERAASDLAQVLSAEWSKTLICFRTRLEAETFLEWLGCQAPFPQLSASSHRDHTHTSLNKATLLSIWISSENSHPSDHPKSNQVRGLPSFGVSTMSEKTPLLPSPSTRANASPRHGLSIVSALRIVGVAAVVGLMCYNIADGKSQPPRMTRVH